MRIIAGEWKGRRLVEFEARHIRPTTDRVKETIFNILQFRWNGAKVLDGFSGTGNLGLEALSRQAAEVTFLEKHPKSLEILRKNMALFPVGSRARVVKQDVLSFLSSYSGEPFDIIIFDPPFTEKMGHQVMETASRSKVWSADSTLVIEVASTERLDEKYGDLVCVDRRTFGDKMAAFFEPTSESVLNETLPDTVNEPES